MKIIINRTDGGISITTCSRVLTPEEVERLIENWKITAEGYEYVSHTVVDGSFPFPAKRARDDEYRGSWQFKAGVVDHNIEKAREIHRDILRRQRKPLLEVLDIQFMAAQERGGSLEIAKIVNEKQRLRDVTDDPRIDAAQSISDLKSLDLLNEKKR